MGKNKNKSYTKEQINKDNRLGYIVSLGKTDPRVRPIELFPDFKHTQKKKLPTYLQSVGGIGKSRQKSVRWYPPDP